MGFQRRKRTRIPDSHIGGPHACYYYYFHDNFNHYLNYNIYHHFHDNFNHYLNYNFYHHFHDNFYHNFHDNKYYHNYNHHDYDNNNHDNFHHNSTSIQAKKEKVDVADFFELIYVELYTQYLHLILF